MTAVSDELAEAMVAARLTPAESQVVFRRLLDALARPGRIAWLPADVARRVPPVLVPLLALCDLEVTCCVVQESETPVDWSQVVSATTAARMVPMHQAAWVAALGPLDGGHVLRLQRGTALAPELGTRLVQACRQLHMGEGEQPWSSTDPDAGHVTVELRGPGIPEQRRVTVTGVGVDYFDALNATNAAFPAGVDMWLVAESGALIGLPRTTKVTVITHGTKGAS